MLRHELLVLRINDLLYRLGEVLFLLYHALRLDNLGDVLIRRYNLNLRRVVLLIRHVWIALVPFIGCRSRIYE